MFDNYYLQDPVRYTFVSRLRTCFRASCKAPALAGEVLIATASMTVLAHYPR